MRYTTHPLTVALHSILTVAHHGILTVALHSMRCREVLLISQIIKSLRVGLPVLIAYHSSFPR